MYARTLRKWSPINIFMYLWLSVIIILVFWCPAGALTMQITPFRSLRSDDRQQTQLQYGAPASPEVQHSKVFSHYSNNNYRDSNINNNLNLNNNNNNNNFNINYDNKNNDNLKTNDNDNNLLKKLITPNNSNRMSNHNVESGPHERLSHKNEDDERTNQQLQQPQQHYANPPSPPKRPATNSSNVWLTRMNEKRLRIMAHRQHLQMLARQKQQLQQPQHPQPQPPPPPMLANDFDYLGRNRRDSRVPQPAAQQLQQRPRQRRYCSARDPQTLAFAAPTVFEGKVKSMSSDRRNNFSVTFEVREIHKKQAGYKVPQNVRLQFTAKTFKNTRECDIYREEFRQRGYVRDELEQGKVYFLFVNQIDLGNFTILGQPIKKTQKIENDVKIGVRDNYGKRASIEFMTSNLTVREGRRVRLMCKVNGQPPPKVTWFKDGRSINRNRLKYNFIHLRRRSELIIKSATTNDTGEYECRAKNKLARKPVSNFTNVKVLPIKYYSPPKNPISWVPSGSPCPEKEGSVFCLNGGTCLYFKDVGEPACRCPDGFDGNRCETKNPSSHTANSDISDPFMMMDSPSGASDYDDDDN